MGPIPGSGRSPGGGHVNPLQYSCLEYPHGQKSLVGYSPWGRKESDTTEQLPFRYHFLNVLGLFSVGLSLLLCFLPREVPLAFVVKLIWWC